MRTRRIIALTSLALGLMTLVAIGIQLSIHISHNYSVFNFFSYFTNLSNIFIAVVLIVEGTATLLGKELPAFWSLIRCSSVTCIALVGVVFTALLRGVELGALLPWINVWLHYVTPIAVVLIWLVYPPRQPIAYKKLGVMVLVPLAYLVYSLIRGAILNWYPYPFLNPANGGYGSVAVTCVGIAIAFVAVTALLIAVGNALGKRASSRAVTA